MDFLHNLGHFLFGMLPLAEAVAAVFVIPLDWLVSGWVDGSNGNKVLSQAGRS